MGASRSVTFFMAGERGMQDICYFHKRKGNEAKAGSGSESSRLGRGKIKARATDYILPEAARP